MKNNPEVAVEDASSHANSISGGEEKKDPQVSESRSPKRKFSRGVSVTNGEYEHKWIGEEFPREFAKKLGISQQDVGYFYDAIEQMSIEDARIILERALAHHKLDRNFGHENYAMIEKLLGDATAEKSEIDAENEDRDYAIRAQACLFEYHSPYPEVRAVTDPYDVGGNCETIRAYVLGLIWVIVGTGVNQFFEPRQPPVSLPPSLFQLLIFPCGWTWAKLVPDVGFTIRGQRISLSPGPWSYKEQILATIMFNVTASLAYINSQIFVQKMDMFYGNKWANAGYQFLLIFSTQIMGFSIAGLLRSVLVYPVQNLWMANFPILALNRTLMSPQSSEPANGWKISTYKFFGLAFVGIFLWQWIPSYLAQFLTYFNWMTWIAPDNFALAAITGSSSGLGINPLSTFDFSTINYLMPMVTPWFAMCNLMGGAILAGCVLIPAVYWSNMYNTAYLPINSSRLYTNKGTSFNVTKILTNNLFDQQKFDNYSPPYYSAANLIVYGTFFANYTAIVVRSLLYDFNVIVEGFKEVFWACLGRGAGIKAFDDAHSLMMHKYPETPMWWFLIVLLVSLALGIGCVEGYPETKTPVWGIFFSLALGVIFMVPIGQLYAQTNQLFSLNVLSELVAGYALPGHGTAMMIIKAFGLNINNQAVNFMSDLKLGHYAKIPPRATFRCQTISTLVAAVVVVGIANWQIANVNDLCLLKHPNGEKNVFSCPNETVYFAASVIWGVMGPKRIFDAQYPLLKYCFLIGCFIPIPFWAVDILGPKLADKLSPPVNGKRVKPSLFVRTLDKCANTVRYIDTNLIMIGILNLFAPYNLTYAVGGFYLNFVFMKYIRTRYIAWFERYHYVLAAALPAGLAFSLIIIFFALQYHPVDLNWWGNTVSFAGADGEGGSLLQLAPGETF